MGLSRFPTVMAGAADDVLKAAEALRYLKNSSGDLPWSDLENIQNRLRSAKISTLASFAEAAKQPESAEAFMANLGGPPTLAAYQAAAARIEAAAYAWNSLLSTWLTSIPASSLIALVSNSHMGVVTKHIERPSYVPAEFSDPLRISPQLAELVSAFEDVGA